VKKHITIPMLLSFATAKFTLGQFLQEYLIEIPATDIRIRSQRKETR